MCEPKSQNISLKTCGGKCCGACSKDSAQESVDSSRNLAGESVRHEQGASNAPLASEGVLDSVAEKDRLELALEQAAPAQNAGGRPLNKEREEALIAHKGGSTDAPDTSSVNPRGEGGTVRRIGPTLDEVTTFGEKGGRVMLYPAAAHGRFTSARALVGLLLIGVYLSLPWLRIGGAPAVFFDIAQRRFHLFGMTFLTQDLWLAFFVISGLGFSLFAITALWGRIWCGWACPLTVFLDVVRRVERFLLGEGVARRRLESEPSTPGVAFRKLLAKLLVGAIAVVVAHGFLAYFVSIPELFAMMHQAPGKHPGAFLLVAFVSAVLWFSLAWFREQFCIVLCPYGRLQSVLTDEHSLVIGYDARRGEPRGRAGKAGKAEEKRGDCVDCLRCVQVCPTGIDIRQGLQLECIGCAACVDACDAVMRKLSRPEGLIRYDSHAGMRGAVRRLFRPRLALYGVLMFFGIVAASFAVSTLRSAVVSVVRMPGPPFFVQAQTVRNQFLMRVFNKHNHSETFQIALEGEDLPLGVQLQGQTREEVGPWGEVQMAMILTVPQANWSKREFRANLVVRAAAGEVIARKPITLVGPNPL